MRFICVPFLLLWMTGSAQNISKELDPIASRKYSWKDPSEKLSRNLLTTVLFEGKGYDMEYVQMSACEVPLTRKRNSLQVPGNEEHLVLVKSGLLMVSFGDSSWSLTPGSIALLMPDEKYSVQSEGKSAARYYLMKYRSKAAPDPARGKRAGGSFVKQWDKLSFREHDRGGVRSYFQKPTAMCRRFEMHVTTLNASLKSHEPHTHRAEEIILLLEDAPGHHAKTEMLIGDSYHKASAGDLYYVGSNLLHGIRNEGDHPCSYFAFQFE